MDTNKFFIKNWIMLALILLFFVLLYLMFGRNNQKQASVNHPFSIESHQPQVFEPAEVPNQAPTTAFSSTETVVSGADVEIWCAMGDGNGNMHIPHLLNDGIDNGRGGQNFHSVISDKIEGSHGVVRHEGRLVYYVSEDYARSAGITHSLTLKAKSLGWVELPMKLKAHGNKRYYVYP